MTHAREPERLRAAQQRVLRHAATLQDEYRRQIPPTAHQRFALADAALRGAVFKESLGDAAGAAEAYDQVLGLAGQDPALAALAGRARFCRAVACKARGELEAADAELRQAVELLQAAPTGDGSRLDLAQALTDWADVAARQRRVPEADARYAAARDRLAQLAGGLDPDAHEACQIRFLAAQNDVMWAALHFSERRPAEEAACYRRAAEAADELLARRPTDALFRRLANQARVGLGDTLRRAGDKRAAEAEYRRAVGHSRRLVEQTPDEADYRALHARSLNQLVIVLDAARAGEKLLAADDAARHAWAAVVKRPDVPLYRSYLRPCIGGFVAASRAARDPVGVARMAETFLTGPAWGGGEEAFAAAALFCSAAGFADAEAARGYADRAVAAFAQAIERGFREPSRVSPDNEFRTVYHREDFLRLLQSLSAKP
jgi:tetratricopeptide (TPR) repeat protein